MACSKSFSVTNARSFNPKNSKVKGDLLHPQAVVVWFVVVLMLKVLLCFWIVRYAHNIMS